MALSVGKDRTYEQIKLIRQEYTPRSHFLRISGSMPTSLLPPGAPAAAAVTAATPPGFSVAVESEEDPPPSSNCERFATSSESLVYR